MTLDLFGHLHAHNIHEKIYLKGDIQEGCKGYNKCGQRETLEVQSIKTTITTNVYGIKQIRSIRLIGNRSQKNKMQLYHIVNCICKYSYMVRIPHVLKQVRLKAHTSLLMIQFATISLQMPIFVPMMFLFIAKYRHFNLLQQFAI